MIMLKKIQQFRDENPFFTVMLIALVVRLLAIFLLPFHGANLERQDTNLTSSLASHVYGNLKESLSPTAVMILGRSFYALVSMVIVALVYRITDLLSDKKKAWIVGTIAAISCIMPSFGIVYLVSTFIGLPFLLYGLLVILRQEVLRDAKHKHKLHRSSFLIAGFSLGLSVCLWRQSAFLLIGILIILLSRREHKECLLTLIGSMIAIGLVIGMLFIFSNNPTQYLTL